MIKALIAVLFGSMAYWAMVPKKENVKQKRYNVNIVYDTTNYAISKDTICYKPNTKVTWADFKGKPQLGTDVAAISSVGFGYGASISATAEVVDLNITVSTFFVRSKSWHVPDVTDYMLAHEQNHVDIGRIGADLFIKNLKKRTITEDNFDTELEAAYKEAWAAYRLLQANFDQESNHGLIKLKQEEWITKIKTQLATVKY